MGEGAGMNVYEFTRMVACLKTDDEVEGGLSNDDVRSTLHELIDTARRVQPRAGYHEPVPSKLSGAAQDAAYQLYGRDSDNDIEIDGDAEVIWSGRDGCCWVQMWGFVREDDLAEMIVSAEEK